MKKKIMALCDSEADYLEGMTAFLKERENFPFELHTYSDKDKLLAFGKKEKIEVLLVAESDFTYEVAALETGKTLLLNESGTIKGENLKNIDKYQKAEKVWQELFESCADMSTGNEKKLCSGERAKIIGFYSPLRRCLQTTLALTLGQVLAENKKTLYLSFEHYAGFSQLLERGVRGDLAALLYFSREQGEKFFYHLQSVTMRVGGLYYVPPAYAGQNLIYAQASEWKDMLVKIAEEGGFDYLVLDLSESIQGTFELLSACDKIYTITGEDDHARTKQEQYEELLSAYGCEAVLKKTDKLPLPHFTFLPERIEQYGMGEVADYVRKLKQESLGED